jgi:hypothetical protein
VFSGSVSRDNCRLSISLDEKWTNVIVRSRSLQSRVRQQASSAI